MKKVFTILFALSAFASHAQISTYPYSEGFESPFSLGVYVFFEPNFYGNEVNAANRIFQDITPHSGTYSCAVVPTSGFDGVIDVNLNLFGVSNAFVNFWASSDANGTGTRPALMYLSTSTDGGGTFSPQVQIGDSTTFPNGASSWNNYQYVLPFNTNNQPDVILRIFVTRGDGSGTTGKLLLDDFTFDFSTSDITPPTVYNAEATAANQIKVAFNEPVNTTAENIANYSGVPGITNANRTAGNDSVVLILSSPLLTGQWYMITISNVEDASGNAMTSPESFDIYFNDNTGNVKITELMYNNPGNDSLTFIEIKNLDNAPLNIGGWRFDRGLNFALPSNLTIPANGYLVFAEFKSLVDVFFGIQSIDYDNSSLSNSGETVSLVNSVDVLIDSVKYDIVLPWDTLANGYGASLVLCDENSDNDLPANWTAATNFQGVYNAVNVTANPMNNCTLTAGVNDLVENNIQLFPNPASNLIIVNGTDHSGNWSLEIHDMQGRFVFEKQIISNTIDLPSLNKGLYIVSVYNHKEKTGSTKLIIE